MAMIGLKGSSGRAFHIHPHMFRRTFARYVARYDTTNLLALKEHFKHLSLSMTDYYVGNDLELWMLMEEETEKVSFESFDKALRADQLAGPGGVRLKKKIDEAIAEGRLEKDFRGEAGDHLRKKMILRPGGSGAANLSLRGVELTAGSTRNPRFAPMGISRFSNTVIRVRVRTRLSRWSTSLTGKK